MALHGSGHELGLLESQRFLIRERTASRQAVRTYDIFDPQTQERIGLIREEPRSLLKLLRSLWSRTIVLTKLEVLETEDESLVFTVHRAVGLWRRRIEVYDADDHLMGYGQNRAFSERGDFWIYDRRGLPFVEIKGVPRGRGCYLLGPDGRELGAVTREGAGSGEQARASADQCSVSIGEELAEQPLAKMLVLGAALAIALDNHGHAK